MKTTENKNMDKSRKYSITGFFKKIIVKQIILATIFTALLFIIVVGNIAPDKITIKIGDIAQEDIRATKDIVDDVATEKLKLESMDRVEPRHRVDPSIQVRIKNEIKKFFSTVIDLRTSEDSNLIRKSQLLEQQSSIELNKNDYLTALKIPDESLDILASNIYDIINQIMGTGIQYEELEYEKENVVRIFKTFDNLSEEAKTLGINIVNSNLKANRFLDMETTIEKKQEAAAQVAPVIIKKGQILAIKNSVIDEETLELIKRTGLLEDNNKVDFGLTGGTLLIIILLELIIIAYLYVFNKNILRNIKHLIIVSIIILTIVTISKSIYGISGYLLPIATATMLISILIDPKLAILVNFILSIIIGLVTGNDINIIIMLLVGGSVGAFGVINTHQRYNIFLTGLVVSGVNMLTIVALGLITDLDIHIIMDQSIYGVLNGIFSSILTIGSLPLWENIFGIITPLKLLELSNPNQPLLKKLLLEAPGTYHHSIVVGNLSEAAAEAIGANTLITRVGSYYHDVGKLKRPYFFKENQFNGDNPHDKLNPSLSTLIITNHTKDGVDFARKYKIPVPIQDIIKQHHGETLVAYFYHKAISGENPNLIQKESFRYEGPKPQSREAAIVMMADSVEAAVRAMHDPTNGKIEGLVRQIIKEKLNDGQLDECGLTLKDLNTIANSFLTILMGIFHERIEYPKLDLSELNGGN